MADSLQASSSIPLPAHQAVKGTQDPLPLSSPLEIGKFAAVRHDADRADAFASFKDYLDQTSITVVERQQAKHQADPVDLILEKSPYGQAGVSFPV